MKENKNLFYHEPSRTITNKRIYFKVKVRVCLCGLWLITSLAFAQNDEASRRATIQFGTETEIAALIQSIRTENVDYLDEELIKLIDNTRNQRILTGVFGFFGEREKPGLEDRAIKAIKEIDDETNETVQSAVDYLGRIKSAKAVPVLIELLDTEERRFLTVGFRALGRAGSATEELADEAAEFLIDFYENRDPGTENQREIIIAIGAAGSKKGTQLLVDIVEDTNERIPLRIAALDSLSKIGDPESLEAILTCVGTNDPNVRAAAVAALGPFSGDEVDTAILDAFRDSFYRTRIAAATASRDRKLLTAIPYLQYRAENDDVPNVRDECVRALGAIANADALEVISKLFNERKNSDRIRMVSAEMLMKHNPDNYVNKLIEEMEEARSKNQTALYNGLLKILGESTVTVITTEYENTARRLIKGSVIEKLYALDMAANSKIRAIAVEIIELTKEKNEGIARRAKRAAEALGLELPTD